MKDRILKFITQEGISATKFADEIGVQRSSVSHILSGRNNPGFDFIQKILNRYRALNAEWLIQGSGAMYKKNENAPVIQDSIPPPKKEVYQPDLFSQKNIKPLTSQEPQISNPIVHETEISASRKVEKILIFYSDKTFEEYLPSK